MHNSRLLLSIFIIVLSSCSYAYYNTLFNAEEYFKKGEDLFKKQAQSGNKQFLKVNNDLETAKLRAYKVLSEFGTTLEENEYADDAYLMIAKAAYYQGDFFTSLEALDTYDEAISDTTLLYDAMLFRAKNNIELRNNVIVKDLFAELEQMPTSRENRTSMLFSYADFLARQNETPELRDSVYMSLERMVLNGEDVKLHGRYVREYSDYLWESKRYADFLAFYARIETSVGAENEATKSLLLLAALHEGASRGSGELSLNIEQLFPSVISVADVFSLNTVAAEKDTSEFFAASRDISHQSAQGLKNMVIGHYYATTLNKVDSSLKYYKAAQPAAARDQRAKDYLAAKVTKYSFLESIASSRKLILAADTVDSPEMKQASQKMLLGLAYSEGEFYYLNNDARLAREKFNHVANSSKLDSALALSARLFLASMDIEREPEKKQEIYESILKDFPESRNHPELRDVLGTELNESSSDENTFDDELSNVDLNLPNFANISRIIEETSADSASLHVERLRYLQVKSLLNNESDSINTTAIRYIRDFKQAFPQSGFLAELNTFQLDTALTNAGSKNSGRRSGNKNDVKVVQNPNAIQEDKFVDPDIEEATALVHPELQFVTSTIFRAEEEKTVILNYEVAANGKLENIKFVTKVSLNLKDEILTYLNSIAIKNPPKKPAKKRRGGLNTRSTLQIEFSPKGKGTLNEMQ